MLWKMIKKLNNKKGQGLPLQTIVIAILVIIVLLVIVVFFVAKIGDTGDNVDTTSGQYTECSTDNPAFQVLTYDNINPKVKGECQDGEGWKPIPGTNCCGRSNDDAENEALNNFK